MRTESDFATHHAKINRFVPAFLDKLEQKRNTSAWTNGTASPTTHQLEIDRVPRDTVFLSDLSGDMVWLV
jgi:hypothetical protein